MKKHRIKIGVIILLLALILGIGYFSQTNDAKIITPIPQTDDVNVIYVTPQK